MLICHNPQGTVNAIIRPAQLLKTYNKSVFEQKTQVLAVGLDTEMNGVNFSRYPVKEYFS